jgi:5'-nucleotidase
MAARGLPPASALLHSAAAKPHMMKKPLILVTNDDGIHAPGLHHLIQTLRSLGDLVVVAPDSPQSAQGHAITIEQPLRLKKVELFDGIEAYACSGTPVDCVKLAKHVVLKDRTVSLCCSGVNHGSNASVNIIYSGTVSAAMEAAMEDIPAMAFSYVAYDHAADMGATAPFIEQLATQMLAGNFGKVALLNVNFPAVNHIKGVRFCRQAEGRWLEKFKEGTDPRGQTYYWLEGKFVSSEADASDTDLWALRHGWISAVPAAHDLTDYQALAELRLRYPHQDFEHPATD